MSVIFHHISLKNKRALGCAVYEIVTYRKLFVESSRVKIREKIENFESAKYLQNLRNIQNEDVTQIIRLVIERFVFQNLFC